MRIYTTSWAHRAPLPLSETEPTLRLYYLRISNKVINHVLFVVCFYDIRKCLIYNPRSVACKVIIKCLGFFYPLYKIIETDLYEKK